MTSKTHRRKVRAQRRRDRPGAPAVLDPHSEVIMQSLAETLDNIAQFATSDDPVADIDAAMTELVDELTARFRGIDPVRVTEVARVACLPWSFDGHIPAGSERGPTQTELIALIAITAAHSVSGTGDADRDARSPEEPSGKADADRSQPQSEQNREPASVIEVVNEAMPLIDRILQLAQLRQVAMADRQDPLAMIAAMVRASEVWIRGTSYADMVARTLIDLFSEPGTSATLRSGLGFEARDAVAVLSSCHTLQVQRFNDRMQAMGETVLGAYLSTSHGNVDESIIASARRVWDDAWEPDIEAATVSAAEIAEATGLPLRVVEAVLGFFSLDIAEKTPWQVVHDFASGLSPLRTNPVITSDGRVMLVHDAQNPVAIREGLERYLKTTGIWEIYQKHRGELLESRTEALFARVLAGAHTWNGFNYYVPADEAEAAGDPGTYTKRVEGDHLIVQDDVAIIVEDKAVAWSGQSQRLHRDLTGIIRKAAEQATRLHDRIQQDGGVRIHGGGWVDLSCIREVHTVAVSLDDLSGASTATAELVKAGVLDIDRIPWTVSVHDLDLITQLVERPAEFLLYLRRRRDPEATVFYTAPDELDLFLYFFEAGLFVEPDPDKVRVALPWMPPVKPAERRRRRRQRPAYITSRTDALDLWHYAMAQDPLEPGAATSVSTEAGAEEAARDGAESDSASAPRKPSMCPSPLGWLIDAVRERSAYAWLSIGATLLSGSTESQKKLARIPRELLENPFGDGRQRSFTIPVATSVEDGWLLVWVTRPPGRDSREFEQTTRDYLRLKMHQLGLPRGTAFCFDETTRELIGVYFDDHVGDLEPGLAAQSRSLLAPEQMTGWQPPGAKIRPGSKQQVKQKGTKKSKKR